MTLAVRDQHLEAPAETVALQNRSAHSMTEGCGHFADLIPRASDIVGVTAGGEGESGLTVTSAGTPGRQRTWPVSRRRIVDQVLSSDVRSDRRPPKGRYA